MKIVPGEEDFISSMPASESGHMHQQQTTRIIFALGMQLDSANSAITYCTDNKTYCVKMRTGHSDSYCLPIHSF